MSHSRARAREIALCRALAMRIIRVCWPSRKVTTGCSAKMKRARGREKRAKIRPVITARKHMPVKISAVATAWP